MHGSARCDDRSAHHLGNVLFWENGEFAREHGDDQPHGDAPVGALSHGHRHESSDSRLKVNVHNRSRILHLRAEHIVVQPTLSWIMQE